MLLLPTAATGTRGCYPHAVICHDARSGSLISAALQGQPAKCRHDSLQRGTAGTRRGRARRLLAAKAEAEPARFTCRIHPANPAQHPTTRPLGRMSSHAPLTEGLQTMTTLTEGKHKVAFLIWERAARFHRETTHPRLGAQETNSHPAPYWAAITTGWQITIADPREHTGSQNAAGILWADVDLPPIADAPGSVMPCAVPAIGYTAMNSSALDGANRGANHHRHHGLGPRFGIILRWA